MSSLLSNRPEPRSAALMTTAVSSGLFMALASGGAAEPQSVFPGGHTDNATETIVVLGHRPSSLDIARARAEITAGGASVIDTADIAQLANVKLSDALSAAPGVVVQDFFGANDQPRLQIRGSGLQQNPVERGVLFLQDGLPLNRADGSYVVGLVDPRQSAFIEVFRGYTANRLGSTVLGGAVNFVLPEGDAAGTHAAVEVGEYGHAFASVQTGRAGERWSALAAASHTERDGFRDYNGSDRNNAHLAFTVDWNETVETRFLGGYVENSFDVAGPLNAAALEADPTQVWTGPEIVGGVPRNPGPNVVRDQPRRDTTLYWIGSRTTASFDRHSVDAAVSHVQSDDSFVFPVPSGERVTDGGDTNLMLRYAYAADNGALPLLEMTTHISVGSADRDYYLNAAGQRGALFGTGELEAATYSVNINANIPIAGNFTLSPSLSYAHAERRFDDLYEDATRPTLAFSPMNPDMRLPDGAIATVDYSYDRDYSEISPALALSWSPNERDYLFLAVSHTFEPPSHNDLIATVNGTPNSSAGRPNPGNPGLQAAVFSTPALEAQSGETLEVGWRSQRGELRFDALVYYSWLDNELLNLRDETGASLGAINAGETRHFGIELGASASVTDRLTARLAYVYQDFRFHDDPVRGDNNLAGVPPHVVNIALNYAITPRLALGASSHWLPDATPVDNLNELYNDAYATFDLRAVFRPTDTWSIFLEGRNIADETYASSTLVVDVARPDQAAYLPGDGRAFYAGLSLEF